jgi:hypothetical protein
MTTATGRECELVPTAGAGGAPALGLLYLDVRGGRLHLLNDAARDLHAAGLPALGNEPSLTYLRKPAGEAVVPTELPLVVAGRQGRSAEAR